MLCADGSVGATPTGRRRYSNVKGVENLRVNPTRFASLRYHYTNAAGFGGLLQQRLRAAPGRGNMLLALVVAADLL